MSNFVILKYFINIGNKCFYLLFISFTYKSAIYLSKWLKKVLFIILFKNFFN